MSLSEEPRASPLQPVPAACLFVHENTNAYEYQIESTPLELERVESYDIMV